MFLSLFFDACFLSAFSNGFSVIERTYSSPAFTIQHSLPGFSAICLAFSHFIHLSPCSSLNAGYCLSVMILWLLSQILQAVSPKHIFLTYYTWLCITFLCSHISGESSATAGLWPAPRRGWAIPPCSVGTNHPWPRALGPASQWRRGGPSCMHTLPRPVARSSEAFLFGKCPGTPASLSHHWWMRKQSLAILLAWEKSRDSVFLHPGYFNFSFPPS